MPESDTLDIKWLDEEKTPESGLDIQWLDEKPSEDRAPERLPALPSPEVPQGKPMVESPGTTFTTPPASIKETPALIGAQTPIISPEAVRAAIDIGSATIPVPRQAQGIVEGLKQGTAEQIAGFTSPESIATAPAFGIPYVGPALALGMGAKSVGTGAGTVAGAIQSGDQEQIGRGLSEIAGGTTMLVAPALHGEILPRRLPEVPSAYRGEKPPEQIRGDETIETTPLDERTGSPIPPPMPPNIRAAIEKAAEIGLNKSAAALAKIEVPEIEFEPLDVQSGAAIAKDLPQQIETPIEKGVTDASTKPSAESVPEPEIRTRVGETTPLRQPGEIAGAQAEPRNVRIQAPAEAQAAPEVSDLKGWEEGQKSTNAAIDYAIANPEALTALEKRQAELAAEAKTDRETFQKLRDKGADLTPAEKQQKLDLMNKLSLSSAGEAHKLTEAIQTIKDIQAGKTDRGEVWRQLTDKGIDLKYTGEGNPALTPAQQTKFESTAKAPTPELPKPAAESVSPAKPVTAPDVINLGNGHRAEIARGKNSIEVTYYDAENATVGHLNVERLPNGKMAVESHSLRPEARQKGYGQSVIEKLGKELGEIWSDENPSESASAMWDRLGAKKESILVDEDRQSRYVYRPSAEKPVTPAAQRKAAAKTFTGRLKEYGEQLGFILRPDDVHDWVGGKGEKHSGASVAAKMAHDREMAAAKRRAIVELGGDPEKPNFAALSAELERRIADYEETQTGGGVHTPLTGKESTDFLPPEKTTPETKPTLPKLASGEKGTGDLLKNVEEPLKLVGEKAVDTERLAAEKAAAEKAKAEAAALQAKQQQGLPLDVESVSGGALGELGMGAAKPGEFQRGQGNPTAMKFRKIDAERQERGLPPVTKPQSVSDQVTMDRAMAAIDADPSLPDRLVNELNNNPRVIEDWENHVLLLHKIELRHEYEKSAREAAQAYDDGRLQDMADANARTGDWSSRLAELEHASRLSGSARGRALRALRVMANEDMTLAALEMRARADKGGAPISALERAMLAKIAEAYKAKADALEQHLAERDQRISEMEAREAIADIQRGVAARNAPSAAIIKLAEQWVQKLDKRADAARQRLKERLGRTSAGIDPTILIDLAEIGASHIGHVGLDFAKWSERMVADVGDWVKPHLAEAYAASQKSLDKLGVPKAAKAVIQHTKDTAADITAKIKAKMDAGAPDEITNLVQRLARQFVEAGVRDRDALIDAVHDQLKTIAPAMTRREAMDAISGYGKFKQLSKEEIDVALRDLKGQMQQVGKLEDMQAGQAPSKTGVERRTPSDEERRLIKQVEEAKKKGGYTVRDPAKQLKSSLDAIKTRLRNQIADLEHQISTGEQIVKEKGAPPTDAEADALRTRRNELAKEYEDIFGKKELTDEQRIAAATKAVQRSIDEYERRIAAGEIKPSQKVSKTPETPDLLAARAWRQALKEHLQELRDLADPKKTPEQKALQGFKTRIANRIAEMQERIASGDFAPKKKREIVMDAEANRLQAEKEQVQADYELAREKKQVSEMNVFQRTKREAGNFYDAARLLLTTGEFSFILRQGKFNTLAHPLRTLKAIPDALRAMKNPVTARAIDLQILNHPDMPRARADKLAIIDEKAPLSRQEELIMGRWADVIPVVSSFNRAARVFLNKIRFDTWQAMRKSVARGGEVTPAESKAIATFVNESTGRGGLGKAGEPAAVLLGRIMFAPRYLASRIQFAAGHSMFMPSSAKTRAVIATEYARALVGLGLYYAMLNWYFTKDGKKPTIETDPRSSDFGKIKLGDTRIDPLAGEAQIATFGARTAMGQTKSPKTGRITPIRGKVPYGKDTWADVAARFARSKAHPVVGTLANLFSGTDLAGNVVTPEGETMKLAAPLTYVDVYQALKEQDLSDGAAMALLAFLGEGLQTYKAGQKAKPMK